MKPCLEPKDEVLFVDNNMADAVPEDTVAETMNMVWALLFLFLSCLLYSCTVTLIKVRSTSYDHSLTHGLKLKDMKHD